MGLESGLSVLLEIESATRVGQSVMLQPELQRSKRNQKNLINSQSGTLGTFSAAVIKLLLKTWAMSGEGKWKHRCSGHQSDELDGSLQEQRNSYRNVLDAEASVQ